jgi:hypothetical protein
MSELFDAMLRMTRAYADMLIASRPIPQRLLKDVCNDEEDVETKEYNVEEDPKNQTPCGPFRP